MSEHTPENCPWGGKVENLVEWQERQNGSLQRIEDKVDKLFYAVLSAGGAIMAALVVVAVTGG